MNRNDVNISFEMLMLNDLRLMKVIDEDLYNKASRRILNSTDSEEDLRKSA